MQESQSKSEDIKMEQWNAWLFDNFKEEEFDFYKKRETSEYFIRILERQGKKLWTDKLEGILEENASPIDACVNVLISESKMAAAIYILPPYFNGKEIEEETVSDALKENKIIFGIDTERINSIVNNKKYFQFFTVAKGLFPVDGEDGQVIDCFPRTSVIDIKEDEKGNVDFKSLNLVHSVCLDDIICNIILPTEGIDGVNVLGNMVRKKPGKAAPVPKGKNTVLSEDKTKLLAAIDGLVSFKHGSFCVEKQLLIDGNVDNSVGNIDFMGDVVVHGDVLNNFTIKAGGDVHIRGMVEGAHIYSGGDIILEKGMNGNKSGILNANGDIKCKFLENCTVHAKGNIRVDSIVWCDVFSGDSIYVENNKGVIIGGSITAKKSVNAKMIGSKSNQKTVITLGYSPDTIKEKQETEENLKVVLSTLETIIKNVNFLSRGSLSDEKKVVFNRLKEQKELYEVQKQQLSDRLDQIISDMEDLSGCRVTSGTIFPTTKVIIGTEYLTVTSVTFKCSVYQSKEKGVVLGTS